MATSLSPIRVRFEHPNLSTAEAWAKAPVEPTEQERGELKAHADGGEGRCHCLIPTVLYLCHSREGGNPLGL